MIIKARIEYLEEFLKDSINKGAFPGACYGIITKEETCYGFLGNAQATPVLKEMSANSVFDIASLTKVIATVTSIIVLMENGALGIYDKVGSILPEFKYKDTTVLQLLTHTSGLPAEVKFYRFCCNYEDIIKSLYKVDLIYEPGKMVLYSDLNFILLGLIVEKLSAITLDKFGKKYIFDPMDMFDTCYCPPENLLPRCAATEYCEGRGMVVGKVHDGNAYAMGGISGHAGLFSTVRDLGNYAAMILDDGSYNGSRIISINSIELMTKCYTGGLNEKRGLGWKLKNPNDEMGDLVSDSVLFHTGFTGTSILIDRDNDVGFVLLTNRIHPTRDNTKLLNLGGYISNIAVTAVDKSGCKKE